MSDSYWLKKLIHLKDADEFKVLDDADEFKVLEDALGFLSSAVGYVDDVSKEAGDVKRVEQVLAFLKKESIILVKYGRDALIKSL